MADNSVEQKIKLNTKDFTEPFKKLVSDIKSGIDGQVKDFFRLNGALNENQNSFKKWGAAAVAASEEFGNGFKKNLAIGAQALTLTAGFEAIKKGASSAVDVIGELDETMALVAAKFDLSSTQVERFRSVINDVAGKTSTDAKKMGSAFNELASAIGDAGVASKSLDSIAKMASLGDKDPTHAAKFAVSQLQGAGLSVNEQNINGLAESAATAEKVGKFANLSEAEEAMTKLGAINYGNLGLSGKEYGSLVGTSSRFSGNQSAGSDALKYLMDAARDPNGQSRLVASLAGSKNGSLMKDGKFDITQIAGLNSSLENSGLHDNNAKINQVSQMLSVTPEVANELLNMSKNMGKFSETMTKANSETDTFGKMYAKATDNVIDATLRFQNKMTTGFADMFEPVKDIYKNLISGHPMDALGGIPKAAVGLADKVGDHPLLALGGLGAIAGGGALLGSIGSKLLGGGGGVAGLAGGVAFGKALQQAGVTPVYVVNAADIKNGGNSGLDAVKGLLGGGATAGGVAGGFGATFGKLAGQAGLVAGALEGGVLVGKGINSLSDKYTSQTNQYGESSNIVERGFGKIASLTGLISNKQYQDMYGQAPQLVRVEVDTKDPQFSAKPSAQNVTRGGSQ